MTTLKPPYGTPTANACGGSMPDHRGVFVGHDLGVVLGAMALQYTPLQHTNS
ncbi:MAG: hypothetical protein ACREE2_00975 [Stellaceae bacterium]